MSDIRPWPNPTGRPVDPPKPIIRPCDYGLILTVDSLEAQVGTIEAYNRLVAAALKLKSKIDAGKAKPQNPIFAVSPRGESSAGSRP
jgi:hypothetical protein